MSALKTSIVVNGWSIHAHSLFLDQLERLIAEVDARKVKDPARWKFKYHAKQLAAIRKLVTRDVPADPASPAFRQGGTLGKARKHWFRVKFRQQYRLFFRYDADAKAIVFAWVNDESTKRAYGARTDAYATFRSMLEGGNPPDDFDALLAASAKNRERFEKALGARAQRRAKKG